MTHVKNYFSVIYSHFNSSTYHELIQKGFKHFWSFFFLNAMVLFFVYLTWFLNELNLTNETFWATTLNYITTILFFLNIALVSFAITLAFCLLTFFILSLVLNVVFKTNLTWREYFISSLYTSTIASSFVVLLVLMAMMSFSAILV